MGDVETLDLNLCEMISATTFGLLLSILSCLCGKLVGTDSMFLRVLDSILAFTFAVAFSYSAASVCCWIIMRNGEHPSSNMIWSLTFLAKVSEA